MPPSAIKTIKDVIFWQYTHIIAASSGMGEKNFGFRMAKFKQLQLGQIEWSSTVREWLKEHEKLNECIYCGSKDNLTTEHILPTSRGGPDIPDNVIKACKSCNSSKGSKRLYEWKGVDNKNSHSRIAEGKYLKLLYKLHEEIGTLNSGVLCPNCDMIKLCADAETTEKLSVYCLEGIFNK